MNQNKSDHINSFEEIIVLDTSWWFLHEFELHCFHVHVFVWLYNNNYEFINSLCISNIYYIYYDVFESIVNKIRVIICSIQMGILNFTYFSFWFDFNSNFNGILIGMLEKLHTTSNIMKEKEAFYEMIRFLRCVELKYMPIIMENV